MDWWRSRRRSGAGLALLALAVQIVLSFGHIHAEDFLATPAASIATPAPPGSAHHHFPPGHPDDRCPICMLVHMAATGLVSVPPSVAIPSGFGWIEHLPPAANAVAVARVVLFRPRAPPAA